jgi:hypothetical protein
MRFRRWIVLPIVVAMLVATACGADAADGGDERHISDSSQRTRELATVLSALGEPAGVESPVMTRLDA